MAKKAIKVGPENFPDKYYKHIKDWVGDAGALSEEELKKTIVECETSIKEQETLQDNDESLKEVKEQVKALSGGYRDAKARQTAKIKYSLYLLEKMGKL